MKEFSFCISKQNQYLENETACPAFSGAFLARLFMKQSRRWEQERPFSANVLSSSHISWTMLSHVGASSNSVRKEKENSSF